MTTSNKPAPTKRALARAQKEKTANPFLDAELYARMRDYTERDAAIIKELKAIAERGAGKVAPDPRHAPSLAAIRPLVKKGISLAEMFDRITAGTEKGLWEPWLGAFGFELRTVNYTGTPRNACIAIDLGAASKAAPAFAKMGILNWRSLVAEDCAELHTEKATETSAFKVVAIYRMDAPVRQTDAAPSAAPPLGE
jgi:hypothetical protein